MNQVCELGMTDKETNNNQKAKQKKEKNQMGRNRNESSSKVKVKMMSCQVERNFPFDIEEKNYPE